MLNRNIFSETDFSVARFTLRLGRWQGRRRLRLWAESRRSCRCGDSVRYDGRPVPKPTLPTATAQYAGSTPYTRLAVVERICGSHCTVLWCRGALKPSPWPWSVILHYISSHTALTFREVRINSVLRALLVISTPHQREAEHRGRGLVHHVRLRTSFQ